MSEDEKIKILIKLHKQSGHASAEKLKTLLKSAGTVNEDIFKMLTRIVDKCEFCYK